MRSYYAVLGQPVDERSFKELDEVSYPRLVTPQKIEIFIFI
jgi:hypothetical protein